MNSIVIQLNFVRIVSMAHYINLILFTNRFDHNYYFVSNKEGYA